MKKEIEHCYVAINLKSFYASVECREGGLDPLTTNLVVADPERTEKTICLAVTPALKAYGVPGRARLFEVVEKVRAVNAERLRHAPGRRFAGASSDANQLAAHPEYALDYIIAVPRMAHYLECSTQIYEIYLNYIAPEDMKLYRKKILSVWENQIHMKISSIYRTISPRCIRRCPARIVRPSSPPSRL